MAAAVVGTVILRLRKPSPWLARPLNGWLRSNCSSSADSSSALTHATKKIRSSFLMYMTEQQNSPGVPEFRNVSERSKYFSEQWKQLSEQDREKYRLAAAQNLAEYSSDRNKEMLARPEQAALQREKKRIRSYKMHAKSLKKEREQNQMPQKPSTAYGLFVSDIFKREDKGGVTQLNIIRNASNLWKQMSVEDKQPFVDGAAEQRAKYKVDMESWMRRMVAEGKGHLIPGCEPTISIPRQSPFAQAVIKAVEASISQPLSKKTIDAILAFLGEKLIALEEADQLEEVDQLDAQQIIHDFAKEWVSMTPARRKRYSVNHAAPTFATESDQKSADKEDEISPKVTKRSPKKPSTKSPGSAAVVSGAASAAASTATTEADVKSIDLQTNASAVRQKATGSRSRRETTAKESDALEAAQAAAAPVQQAQTELSESSDKPAKQKKKRRPVDTNTTSEDTD